MFPIKRNVFFPDMEYVSGDVNVGDRSLPISRLGGLSLNIPSPLTPEEQGLVIAHTPTPIVPNFGPATITPDRQLPSEQAYRDVLAQMPVQQPLSVKDRILNAIVAGSVGLQEGGLAGVKTALQLRNAPYQRQLQEWKTKVGSIAPTYQMDQAAWQRGEKAAALGREIGAAQAKALTDQANIDIKKEKNVQGWEGLRIKQEQANTAAAAQKATQRHQENDIEIRQDNLKRLQESDRQKNLPRHVAAINVAYENNVQLDPNKDVFDQLSPELQQQAIKRENDYKKDPLTHELAAQRLADMQDRSEERRDRIMYENQAADQALGSINANPKAMYDILKPLEPRVRTRVIARLNEPMLGKNIQGREKTRIDSANIAIEVAQDLLKVVDDPEITNGPVMGRVLKAKQKIGNLTQKQAWAANKLLYLQANEAGSFTATGGASKYILDAFSKPAADLRQNEENLKGALYAALNHALETKKAIEGKLTPEEQALYEESNPFREKHDKMLPKDTHLSPKGYKVQILER